MNCKLLVSKLFWGNAKTHSYDTSDNPENGLASYSLSFLIPNFSFLYPHMQFTSMTNYTRYRSESLKTQFIHRDQEKMILKLSDKEWTTFHTNSQRKQVMKYKTVPIHGLNKYRQVGAKCMLKWTTTEDANIRTAISRKETHGEWGLYITSKHKSSLTDIKNLNSQNH